MVISIKLDEFSFILGLFASDGNLDKGRVRFFCSEEEKEFFDNTISPMLRRLFGCNTTMRHDIKKNYVLSINSTKVEKRFREIFPYKGKKHLNIRKPEVEFDEISFMAGLVAGDGSLIISKNGSEKSKYPMLAYVSASKTLINLFSSILRKNAISHYICNRKNGCYHIAVKGCNLKTLLMLMPLINDVQKSKIDVLNMTDRLKPHSTYEERLSILSKNAPLV